MSKELTKEETEFIREYVSNEDKALVYDLSILVARLSYRVLKDNPDNATAKQAMDFLQRKGLGPGILRRTGESQ
jgi:hypothetical protein